MKGNIMKTLQRFCLFILFLFTLQGCGSSGGGSSTPTPVPNQEPPQPPIEPPAVVYNLFIKYSDSVAISDGSTVDDLMLGQVANARDGFISVDDILYGIDTDGSEVISQRLITTPDAIAIGADTWIFEKIPSADAYAMGGLPRPYVRIYQNADIYSEWYLNKWEVVDAFITDSGNLIAVDTVGRFRNIFDESLTVSYAQHNGLMIHSTDIDTHRSTITTSDGDFRVAYTFNYFFGANQWLYSPDSELWYSWNGYTFDGANLSELATSMTDFILTGPNSPAVIAAGTRVEHSETVLYWIECNDGWLYRYTPSIDRLEQVARLYMGSGERLDGVI
jgi:hypothetical protein